MPSVEDDEIVYECLAVSPDLWLKMINKSELGNALAQSSMFKHLTKNRIASKEPTWFFWVSADVGVVIGVE